MVDGENGSISGNVDYIFEKVSFLSSPIFSWELIEF